MLIIDIAYFERALFTSGERGPMVDCKSGRVRLVEALLSLSGLLHSFGIEPPCALHNAGNDAFMTLVAFQRMVDRRGMVTVPRGMWTGVENGMGKGEMPTENGHIRRAARSFWPLGGPQPHLGKVANGNGNGSIAQRRAGDHGGDGVDEMGTNVNKKRASMFASPLLVPADKSLKKMASHAGTTGSGRWLSSSTIPPGRKR